VVAGPLYRSAHSDNEIYYMYGYLACFDAIAIGCLTALLARRMRPSARYRRVLRLLSGVCLVAVYLRGIGGHEVFGFSMIAFAAAAFLIGAANDRAPGWTAGRASAGLRWMGRHSYELYLFHIIVLGLMRNVVDKARLGYHERLPWLALFVLLSALAAALVARYVAEPANRALRKYFFTGRGDVSAAMCHNSAASGG
jgi:peptidoglycan/LPS O-acetylase OafA/YrhL